MTINAIKLKETKIPDRTKLYEVRNSCDIVVEEEQVDHSLDQVVLEYRLRGNSVGYFAKEYRPEGVPKKGAKGIDVTAIMLDHEEKCIRWHLYDIKDTLAGRTTVITLYNQWNAGLEYLRQNVLALLPEYLKIPDLGVVTRSYDEERMKRLRDDCRKHCDEMGDRRQGMTTLAQRKKETEVAKYRAAFRAAQAILEQKFQAENGVDTYEIRIRYLCCENAQLYKMNFSV